MSVVTNTEEGRQKLMELCRSYLGRVRPQRPTQGPWSEHVDVEAAVRMGVQVQTTVVLPLLAFALVELLSPPVTPAHDPNQEWRRGRCLCVACISDELRQAADHVGRGLATLGALRRART